MKKNYLATLALVFCASLCAAQTEKQESKAATSDKQQKVISDEKSSVITAQNKSSKRTKIAPEIFYVVDDKAVDYKTYLLHLQKTKNQH
jgi:hypothetical protein